MAEVNQVMREEYIRQVRYVGESLIKNAESIVGTEKYVGDLRLYISINPNESVPTIQIDRTFVPENFVEEHKYGDD